MKLQVSFYLIFIIYRLLAITSILLALLLFLIIIHLIIFGRIDAPEFEYSLPNGYEAIPLTIIMIMSFFFGYCLWFSKNNAVSLIYLSLVFIIISILNVIFLAVESATITERIISVLEISFIPIFVILTIHFIQKSAWIKFKRSYDNIKN